MQKENTVWSRSNKDVFWGEIAPCEHILQIYENDDAFLDVLLSFVGDGFRKNECVIVIASQGHLDLLEQRLVSIGISVETLKTIDRYIPLNAEETLSKFMVKGWPDETLFNQIVSSIIQKANTNGYIVRAFGEMVALLWEQGNYGATVQLEELWNKFCAKEAFSLFCAYPKAGFTDSATNSVSHICEAHSKMILGSNPVLNEILYRDTLKKIA